MSRWPSRGVSGLPPGAAWPKCSTSTRGRGLLPVCLTPGHSTLSRSRGLVRSRLREDGLQGPPLARGDALLLRRGPVDTEAGPTPLRD